MTIEEIEKDLDETTSWVINIASLVQYLAELAIENPRITVVEADQIKELLKKI